MEAIVLCGGLGTRLRSVLKDRPKPMAPVGDKPFLTFIFKYLKAQGVKRVVLAVSYQYSKIQNYFKDEFLGLEIAYSIEKEPLGTGGALQLALTLTQQKEIFVLNGDTIFDIPLKQLKLENSKLCMALKKMSNFERYGCVELDENGFIKLFKEKKPTKEGLINGGIYLVSEDIFSGFYLKDKFSFEDFLQKNFKKLIARAEIFEDYFIDIGVPSDYELFCSLEKTKDNALSFF
ncbi:nucleotidyltransferase family protein [Campylobacter cuniculorum]|nr:nucleotidyltransferase family protein [Campylobacter cuniculorum]QOR04215.1 nucleotidyltransferase family protein [Campylobacter cuniculorum]